MWWLLINVLTLKVNTFMMALIATKCLAEYRYTGQKGMVLKWTWKRLIIIGVSSTSVRLGPGLVVGRGSESWAVFHQLILLILLTGFLLVFSIHLEVYAKATLSLQSFSPVADAFSHLFEKGRRGGLFTGFEIVSNREEVCNTQTT